MSVSPCVMGLSMQGGEVMFIRLFITLMAYPLFHKACEAHAQLKGPAAPQPAAPQPAAPQPVPPGDAAAPPVHPTLSRKAKWAKMEEVLRMPIMTKALFTPSSGAQRSARSGARDTAECFYCPTSKEGKKEALKKWQEAGVEEHFELFHGVSKHINLQWYACREGA